MSGEHPMEMKNDQRRPKRKWTILAIAALLFVAAAAVGYVYFAPQGATRVDQSMKAGGAEAVALTGGTFTGADSFHNVEGTVTLLRSEAGYFLRFEDYEATNGPDVFFYLTRTANARSTGDVEGEGLLVLVPGGASGGQATLRGNFNVPLPADLDPAEWRGIVAWCDRFNVLFGSAPLT